MVGFCISQPICYMWDLKVEYVDKLGVWQYIRGWCGLIGIYGPSLVDYSTTDIFTLPILWRDISHFIKYTALRRRINRSSVCLNQGQWNQHFYRRIIIKWYMQRQEICESGRFAPCPNCRDQRSRLKEAERILERYGVDTNKVHIVDEARYWFRILSRTNFNLWHNISFQCSYCDCKDLPSRCKYLSEFRWALRDMCHPYVVRCNL